MSETFSEYAQRLRGYLAGADPLESMQKTPTVLSDLLKGVPEALLTNPPLPGSWSVAEIVAHLADAELVSGFRFRSIAGADDGVPIPAYDQDRWAKAGNYRALRIDFSLPSFLAMRQMNVRFLTSLPADAWDKYGIHSERGRESLRELVTLVAGHDLNHIRQIQKILSSAQAA